jgi:hypothetical protein
MGLFDFFKRKPAAPVYEPATPQIPGAPAVDLYAFRGKAEDYFFQLLQGHYTNYEIRSNVVPMTIHQLQNTPWTCVCSHSNTVGASVCARCARPQPQDYYPISLLMLRGGIPVLAVLLCDKSRANVRRTLRACAAAGIPCQCYYTHFRNKASYVIDRINADLR